MTRKERRYEIKAKPLFVSCLDWTEGEKGMQEEYHALSSFLRYAEKRRREECKRRPPPLSCEETEDGRKDKGITPFIPGLPFTAIQREEAEKNRLHVREGMFTLSLYLG